MKTDVQIAQEIELLAIEDIGKKLDIDEKYLIKYGRDKAKINLDIMKDLKDVKEGKLILVTAINPTPAGEGKTTTNIGLAMALDKIGKRAVTTIREPSLGPSFGLKGGAAGGGYSQVLPMADINLHFTGDFHAITSAHNLIAALLDNHIHQGNELNIDTRNIPFKRVMDMNERALRNIVVGLGGKPNGVPREDGFDITVASEIMAILCLAKDLDDFKEKISKMIVAYNLEGEPIYVKDLKAEGAVTVLMKDAIHPNVVQTTEGTPAIIHGGPFANIAHGCNSLVATQLSIKLADYTITEAGFGADLGAEKFFNIKSRLGGLNPDGAVIVATVRALKYNGGVEVADLGEEDLEALRSGFVNLQKHIENVKSFNMPVLVAINKFPTDTDSEINLLKEMCEEIGVNAYISEVWAKGGDGAIEIAEALVEMVEAENEISFTYDVEDSIEEKIEKIAKNIYGADGVDFTAKAKKDIKGLEELGLDKKPICMAKTQYSLSDDPEKLGRPEGFRITIREVKNSNGAGFLVALAGSIMTMPGLPKKPAAVEMDIVNGEIVGLF